MRYSDDINHGPFGELIEGGKLYQAFAAAERLDYLDLYEGPSELKGVEYVGEAARLPDGPKVGG